jgi:hypothetical protein
MKNKFPLVRPVDGHIVETGFTVHHDSIINLLKRGFTVVQKNKKFRTDFPGYAVNLLLINQKNILFNKNAWKRSSKEVSKKRLTLARIKTGIQREIHRI